MTLKPSKPNGQSGSIFLSTMISVFIMVIAAGSIFSLTSQDMIFVNRLKKSTQARHLAEAGLAAAISSLKTSWSSAKTFPAASLANGSYQAKIVTTQGRSLVTSTGTVDKVSRSVSAEVTEPVSSSMDYALASGSWLEYEFESSNSSGVLVGNMYSGAQMEFENNTGNPPTTINGDARATTYFEMGHNAVITGTKTANYKTHVPFPTIDLVYFQSIAQTNGQYFAGSKVYNSGEIPAAPAGGVIYVAGSCAIYGTQSTNATLIVGGSLAIQKTGNTYPKVTITKTDIMPALVVMGDTTFQSTGTGGAYLTVRGFMYNGGSFTFKPNHSDFKLVGQINARGHIEIDPESYSSANVVYWAQSPAGVSAPSSQFGVESFNS